MKLAAFFWSYARRYVPWAVASVLALVLYGATAASMLALLPPLFDEVLLAGGERPSIGVLSAPEDAPVAAEATPEGAPSDRLDAAEKWITGLSDRAREWAVDKYEGVKRRFGISEGNRFATPVAVIPLLFVIVLALRGLFSFATAYSFQRIGFGITTDIRNDLYDFLLRQSISFHGEHTSGELYSRVINDVAKLQAAVSSRLIDLFQQSVMLVLCLAYLFLVHAKLAFFSLVAMPLFVYPVVRFGKGMRKTSHRSQERMADLSALLTEGVRGNRVVKAFGMERFESGRFRAATAQHLRVNLKAQRLAAASGPVVETVAAFCAGALFVYAGLMIRRGELEPSLFLSFITALVLLYDPIRKLNKANMIFQEALAAGQRVCKILDEPNEIVDAGTHPPIETLERSVRFDSVSFSYAAKPVLVDLSLEISAGEVVALVGPSGAGKTTVVNLLPRFFDPDAGTISIDGVGVRDLPLANLRSLIGIVTQDTVLFNDTVRNNIAYGRADLPLERVREAAAAAYADEFIMELEHGYDSVIGEGGSQLSGGQRQRLAIARALLKNAPILILDEATSQLDTESEQLVQRAIYNLMEGRTALVIAHRLSTVTRADRIVVMEQGRIVEQGTHAQLLEQGGAYKRLYDLQFP